MSVNMRVRTSFFTAASAAVIASLVGVGTGPAGAAEQVDPQPPSESQSLVDSPRDLQREQQRANARTALAGTIPQRLQKAGADPALGSRVSAVVLDATTGAVVYSRNGTLALMPASNQKLNTAFVALSSMPATKTFQTHVKASSNKQILWIVGAGDPGLTITRAREMAGTARAALVKAGVKTVAVRVDDTLFPAPTNAVGWKTSYLPGDVVPVRPLVVGGRNAMDSAMDAGVIFSNELKRLGTTVSSTTRGKVATGSATLVSATSLPVSTLVSQTINSSNNDYAEAIHRQSSLAAAKGATWAAANGHAIATLRAKGVNTTGTVIADGSGLSRSDRMSATNVTSLLLAIRRSATINNIIYAPNAMPIAGVSGTLATRFAQPDTICARGKVRAKSGTLSDVTALSGTAYSVDGKQRIFSIVENGAADTAAARFALERFATAAVGCDPA